MGPARRLSRRLCIRTCEIIPAASYRASSSRNGFSQRQSAMQRTTKLNVAFCRSSVRNVLWIAHAPGPYIQRESRALQLLTKNTGMGLFATESARAACVEGAAGGVVDGCFGC